MKPWNCLAAVPVVVAMAASTPVGAQPQDNRPTAIKSAQAADVEVRYLDFKWDEAAFTALEKGTATRSWTLGRIMSPKPLQIDGKPLTGGSLLILNPATPGGPMTLEVRVVDMRAIVSEMNVLTEPPAGTTIYKKPAAFANVEQMAERLTVGLTEEAGKFTLTMHIGNRKATIEAQRQP